MATRYRIFKKGSNTPLFSSDNWSKIEEYWNKLASYTNPTLFYYVGELKGGLYQEIEQPKFSRQKHGW